ncbi:hypothetical protein [Chromobacterium haemolyticum]|uniref:hypothetical protein n=1 Tax=Chromobacterium haemolyticum TaxID=394935 RepID=UPI00244B4398|nr:hypothetical protein [Chromobacterium haemolyticum]MDH0342104.1 hypothetical protein [Chromobacterium haemolyticum]
MSAPKTKEPLRDAEARYSLIRGEVYRIAAAACLWEMQQKVLFTSITEETARRADKWVYPPERSHHQPGWGWLKELKKFKRRPRRIEAAIWSLDDDGGQVLCGLVLGRVSNSRIIASITYLEGNPEQPNPLAGVVAQLAIRYLQIHATALHCTVLGINQPRPDLVEFYRELGFSRKIEKKGKVFRLEREVAIELGS